MNKMCLEVAEEWTVKYYQSLYKYALCRLNDVELVKDLVQDTILEGLQGLNQYQQRSSESTWLTAILKYKIYKVYRSRLKNRLTYLAEDDLQSIAVVRINGDIQLTYQHLEDIVDKEFNAAIGKFILTLPLQWQKVYDMKYVDNSSTPDICQKLNLSDSNYWVISHRLKLSLKNWYVNYWIKV